MDSSESTGSCAAGNASTATPRKLVSSSIVDQSMAGRFEDCRFHFGVLRLVTVEKCDALKILLPLARAFAKAEVFLATLMVPIRRGDDASFYLSGTDWLFVVTIKNSIQDEHCKSSSSIFDPCIIDDDDQNFPISVEKYAEQLQHKEGLGSSTSRASTLSSIKTPIVILDSEDSPASTSSSTKPPIVILDSEDSPASTSSSMKPPIVILESSQVPDRFCDICMDTKTDSEMFRNTNVCG
nr:zinc finger, C6HC-type [Tanacetum cinerariifolium]